MGEIVLQIVATIPRLRRVRRAETDVVQPVATTPHLRRVLHAGMDAVLLAVITRHHLLVQRVAMDVAHLVVIIVQGVTETVKVNAIVLVVENVFLLVMTSVALRVAM